MLTSKQLNVLTNEQVWALFQTLDDRCKSLYDFYHALRKECGITDVQLRKIGYDNLLTEEHKERYEAEEGKNKEDE